MGMPTLLKSSRNPLGHDLYTLSFATCVAVAEYIIREYLLEQRHRLHNGINPYDVR